MEGLAVALPFYNTAEVDLLNFGASLSFDLCKAGHCDQLLDRAKYTGLVTLLGALLYVYIDLDSKLGVLV